MMISTEFKNVVKVIAHRFYVITYTSKFCIKLTKLTKSYSARVVT